ncbi:hypothetical protein [Streptomyces sp. NPDC051546]|uniref:hypothetical protein n=1 Tax=Streptomyces sp. NPDC051546 TaxID=3365655 RepID=UPI0037A8E2C5
MNSTLTAPPTAPSENDLHPGHSPILEPPEGPESALGCTCGGLLDLDPGPKPVKMIRFDQHVEEARCKSNLD